MELGESYIPDEHQSRYFAIKQMCYDPDTLIIECMEKAEDYVPEEHKDKFDLALNIYKNSESAEGNALKMAEGYIPESYMGYYTSSKSWYTDPKAQASSLVDPEYRNQFDSGMAMAEQAYGSVMYLKAKKDEL